MACWVVPAVAAELWGVPVAHVLARVEEGSLLSKTDAGFLFVDMLPDRPAGEGYSTAAEPPTTYTVISRAEEDALAADDLAAEVVAEAPPAAADPAAADEQAEVDPDEVDNPFDEQTPTFSAKDWRRVRSAVGRSRKPPVRKPPLAA